MAMGAIGVTGTGAANALAAEADVILGVGTRFADFTTGSWALFKNPDRRFIGLNVQPFDAAKHRALPVVGDARVGARRARRGARRTGRRPTPGPTAAVKAKAEWEATAARYTGAYQRAIADRRRSARRADARGREDATSSSAPPADCRANCTSCGGPARRSATIVEYGYSCMGYEIAGGIGVKMALPDREVVVTIGDGSYLMMNSEIATSVMLGKKLIIVVNDNRGFGCINRLQQATGGAPFNNLLRDARHEALPDDRLRRACALAGRRGGEGRLDRRA